MKMGLSERKMGMGGKKGKGLLGEYGAEATEGGSWVEGDSVCRGGWVRPGLTSQW